MASLKRIELPVMMPCHCEQSEAI